MRITSFDKPSATTTVAPGSGIMWTLAGGSISVKGDWHYKYKVNLLIGSTHVSDSGSFDLSVTGLNLRLSIMLGMSNSGQPTIYTTGCSSDVGRVHVHLHGGASWLYNLFDDNIGDSVKDSLRDTGEMFVQGVMTEAPFQPLPLPDLTSDGTRMMTFWASEYVLNTLGYLLQKYSRLEYNLLNKDLSKHFPNSSVMIHLVSTGKEDQPWFTMLPGDLQLHLAGMAYYTVQTNTTDVHLFKARVVVVADTLLCGCTPYYAGVRLNMRVYALLCGCTPVITTVRSSGHFLIYNNTSTVTPRQCRHLTTIIRIQPHRPRHDRAMEASPQVRRRRTEMATRLRDAGATQLAGEGLPSASLFDPRTRNLVVTDDLMAITEGRVTTLFT
ncbi:hypothetical protein LSAT2_022446 [Lamellibrachia satsuma]|nr:hypothetical protein LSAT2_022446 [Lamellibrachia satsuma]